MASLQGRLYSQDYAITSGNKAEHICSSTFCVPLDALLDRLWFSSPTTEWFTGRSVVSGVMSLTVRLYDDVVGGTLTRMKKHVTSLALVCGVTFKPNLDAESTNVGRRTKSVAWPFLTQSVAESHAPWAIACKPIYPEIVAWLHAKHHRLHGDAASAPD
ncbi:hypothetical protein [Rhizobium leguminosarum]|uniref:hypothetical protein n=1 Tax=Rhizobium leguminosarum TaxID=384 RepID=UPI0024B32F6F|nr:hypothetical protein [Rhizobium leguminosarum]WHO82635.1 hypothetical protein QMO81_005507 [Rhizobium leguminosarum]